MEIGSKIPFLIARVASHILFRYEVEVRGGWMDGWREVESRRVDFLELFLLPAHYMGE